MMNRNKKETEEPQRSRSPGSALEARARTAESGANYLLSAGLVLALPAGGVLGLLILVLLIVAGVWWARRKPNAPRRRAVGSFEGDPPLVFPILPSDPPEILRAGRPATRPAMPAGRRPAIPPSAAPRPPRRAQPAVPQETPDIAPPEAPPAARASEKKPPRERAPRRTRGDSARERPPEAAPAARAESPRPARSNRGTRRAPAEPPIQLPLEAPPTEQPAEPLRPAAVLSTAAHSDAALPAPAPVEEGELFDGNTVRYYRPVEGTMQFLPGRLEIVEGEDRGQDIRFVRIWGASPEVTFGRSPGPPHRHIQLRARTVSREHARMNFEEDHWRIHNLSRTNPIVVNGQELHSTDEVLTLRDGDLIEMGEVVFRFRER